MNWIQMNQGQWWSCLNKIMNLGFYKMQETLTSWETKFAQWSHLVTTERLCPVNDMKYLRLCSKGSRERRNIRNFMQMQQNNFFLLSEHCPSIFLVEASWSVMAHAQKPDFIFQRNGQIHLNWRGWQFSRLLAAKVHQLLLFVVMMNTPSTEVVWRVLATHSVRQFSLHFPSRASLCAITFQLESTIFHYSTNICHILYFILLVPPPRILSCCIYNQESRII